MNTSHATLGNHQLLRLSAAGDWQARNALYERFEGLLRASALQVAANRDAGEELFAEATARWLARVGSVKCAGALPQWTRSLVRNLWLDHAGRARRSIAFSQLGAAEEADGDAPAWEPAADPEEALLAGIQAWDALGWLAERSPRQAYAIYAHDLCGHSFEELGGSETANSAPKAERASAASWRSWHSRGLRRMREAFPTV